MQLCPPKAIGGWFPGFCLLNYFDGIDTYDNYSHCINGTLTKNLPGIPIGSYVHVEICDGITLQATYVSSKEKADSFNDPRIDFWHEDDSFTDFKNFRVSLIFNEGKDEIDMLEGESGEKYKCGFFLSYLHGMEIISPHYQIIGDNTKGELKMDAFGGIPSGSKIYIKMKDNETLNICYTSQTDYDNFKWKRNNQGQWWEQPFCKKKQMRVELKFIEL